MEPHAPRESAQGGDQGEGRKRVLRPFEAQPRGASKQVEKEAADIAALGGLRNPWRAVQRNAALAAAGARARRVLDSFVDEHPAIMGLLELLGDARVSEIPAQLQTLVS